MKKEEKSKKDSKSQSEWVDLNNFPPKNQRIIVFDIETTGLNHLKHQINEIAAIEIENGKITGQQFHIYIKQRVPSDTEGTFQASKVKEELFNEVLKDLVGENISSKGDLIKLFQEYSSGRGEYESIKDALKQVYKTGYGIVLPKVTDMKLEKPEVIKQGGRYGIKLQAKASSIHLVKVDVESSFEPIIGSELQSKELIDHLMKNENKKKKIWQSEIFGRSLDEIVSEGIQAKLSLLSEASKYKLSQTIQKMVNKGSSNLIAIVL